MTPLTLSKRMRNKEQSNSKEVKFERMVLRPRAMVFPRFLGLARRETGGGGEVLYVFPGPTGKSGYLGEPNTKRREIRCHNGEL